MKVLHVLAQLPMHTGSGIYFNNLVQGLHERTDITNAVLYAVQVPIEVDFGTVQAFPVQFKTEDLPFPIVGMSDEMPYESTKYAEMSENQVLNWRDAFVKKLNQVQQEFKPDLIIVHHLWYLTSIVLDLFPSIPVIGISHGTDIRQALQNPHLKTQYVHQLNRLACVFALSEKDKKQVEEIFEIDQEKIFITGAGFNHRVFNATHHTKEGDSINILYAGKISRSKGVFELAQTFPKLKEKHPEIVFHVVGNADQEGKDSLKESANQSKDFIFHDVKSQPELAKCMQACDIFVLPSYYEGMGLIAIEALACKLRVVVTEIEGLMELLGEEVNQSKVISYVPLPRLHHLDQPMDEDIGEYIDNLTVAIDEQIKRVKDNEAFPPEIYQKIYRHSWAEVIKEQLKVIEEVYHDHYSK